MESSLRLSAAPWLCRFAESKANLVPVPSNSSTLYAEIFVLYSDPRVPDFTVIVLVSFLSVQWKLAIHRIPHLLDLLVVPGCRPEKCKRGVRNRRNGQSRLAGDIIGINFRL